ncbi:hypothetical protein XFF6992_510104 [Xanthomonas citri pv. fuscans]|nr:hypothetical protein XFF6990_60028 [Xanthomonas citri pv. fuscans]SOO21148.1 hypothetical protein XFF6992_510104 [Xanthomonas citri pv. fuscans]SOO35210.1 hypothetical protein XFF6994_5110027 [Xanthomonas citri pv. fuscans]
MGRRRPEGVDEGRGNTLGDGSCDERVATRQPGQTMGLHKRPATVPSPQPLSRWERGLIT